MTTPEASEFQESDELSPAQTMVNEILQIFRDKCGGELDYFQHTPELALFLRANGLSAYTIKPVIAYGMSLEVDPEEAGNSKARQAILGLCAEDPEALRNIDRTQDSKERDWLLYMWANASYKIFPNQVIQALLDRYPDPVDLPLYYEKRKIEEVYDGIVFFEDEIPQNINLHRRDLIKWGKKLFAGEIYELPWEDHARVNYFPEVYVKIVQAQALQAQELSYRK